MIVAIICDIYACVLSLSLSIIHIKLQAQHGSMKLKVFFTGSQYFGIIMMNELGFAEA